VSRFSPVSTTSVRIELIPANLADSSLDDYEVPGRTLTTYLGDRILKAFKGIGKGGANGS
jgi:hypothetical protein